MRSALLCLALAAACHAKPAPSTAPPLPQLPAPPPERVPAIEPSAPQAFQDAPDPALTPLDAADHQQARKLAQAGQWHDAKRLLGKLVFAYPDHAVLLAQYNAVASHIEQAQRAAKASLEATKLVTPPAPPAGYVLVKPANAPPKIPKLVKKSQVKNGIVNGEDWFAKNGIHLPEYFVEAPGDMFWAPGVLSVAVVADVRSPYVLVAREISHRYLDEPLPIFVPGAYGSLALLRAIDAKPYLVAIYGGRVVVVFDERHAALATFDFAEFVHPPASVAGQAKVGEYRLNRDGVETRGDLTQATQSITLLLEHATAADGVLYVEHRFNGYTKEAKGQTGYVSALDLATGELLWHSKPLMANGETFAVVDGALVTGYGFTAEPRAVHVLDRRTGATVQTLPTSTTPELFVVKGDELYVRGYDSDFVFAIH